MKKKKNIFYLAKPVKPEIRNFFSLSILFQGDDYRFAMKWIGQGLVTSTGKLWHSRRKMITAAFHFGIVEGFVDTMNEHARTLCQKLEEKVDSAKDFDAYPYFARCALDIICETAMGRFIDAQNDCDSREA